MPHQYLRRSVKMSISALVAAALVSALALPGDAEEPAIEIGWVGPQSGVTASLGHWDIAGIQLAFEQQNAKGGVFGRKLQLITLDDAGEPTQSVNNVKRLLAQNHIVACFCGPQSGNTLAVEPFLTAAKIPQITSGLALNLTEQGSAYIFRDTPAGPAFESTLVDFLVTKKHFKSFAIITDTTDYGQGEAKYQTTRLAKLGITPATVQSYNPKDTDFTGQLNAIIALKPQVLLFGGSEVASGLIAKQARQLGFTGQLAGGSALGTPKFVEVAGPDVAQGAFFASAYISNDRNAQTKGFARAYEALWKEVPEAHGAKAYDGAMMLIEAIKAARSQNYSPSAVAAALHNLKAIHGLQGDGSIDERGESFHSTSIGTIDRGHLVPL